MTVTHLIPGKLTNLPFYEERVDLACAFRWTARLNMHEAVAISRWRSTTTARSS
jgi:hypothetical protein